MKRLVYICSTNWCHQVVVFDEYVAHFHSAAAVVCYLGNGRLKREVLHIECRGVHRGDDDHGDIRVTRWGVFGEVEGGVDAALVVQSDGLQVTCDGTETTLMRGKLRGINVHVNEQKVAPHMAALPGPG